MSMGNAIVVTYHSGRSIVACLKSLIDARLHVVVVDNGGTADLVSDHFPHLELIANDKNRGFAAAVNQGLERCREDAVLLVNPDCVVPQTTSSALLEFLRAHDDVGVVGPRLRESDGTIQISAHPRPGVLTLLANRARRLLPDRFTGLLARHRQWSAYHACLYGTEPTDVDWLTGACLALRTDTFRDLGGLDEGYFMYYEDLHLCLQMWERGHRVVYLPNVEAVHEEGGSSADRSFVWPVHTHSTLRFYALHRPYSFALVRVILLIRALTGLAFGVAQDRRDPSGKRVRAWRSVVRVALAPRREFVA